MPVVESFSSSSFQIAPLIYSCSVFVLSFSNPRQTTQRLRLDFENEVRARREEIGGVGGGGRVVDGGVRGGDSQLTQAMRLHRSLEVCKMGFVNYLEALKLQEKLVLDRKMGHIQDILLALQHPPTYTLGKRRTSHNLLVSEDELQCIGAALHYTERGGDITFHGPRQAILYPIISLRDLGLGARKYVENLELTMIKFASLYGVTARRGSKCETGVWVEDRKIGAIGVRISSGITSHGLAFNIDPDLNYFKHIVPCGIADKGVTSLRKETDVAFPADEVLQEQLISCFASIFGFTTVVKQDNINMSGCEKKGI